MGNAFLDNPLVTSIMFYPRRVAQGTNLPPDSYDGVINAQDGTAIGYRLHDNPDAKAMLLFFHGNGEVAADYGDIINLFHDTGVAVLIADFRGYGWSEGKPGGSALLTDAADVLQALPETLRRHRPALAGLPLVVMGRSLGSAPASYIARHHPETIKGVIIESGFSSGRDWMLRKIRLIGGMLPLDNLPDVLPNASWVAESGLPLLVIHGENDTLIPPMHGHAFYDQSSAHPKDIVIIPNAGHNDLMMVGMKRYFMAMKSFIETVIS